VWRRILPFPDAEGAPHDDQLGEVLPADYERVREVWRTTIDRRDTDPGGAITTSRTLLESLCKHTLDELKVAYDPKADLPPLYGAVAKELGLVAGGKDSAGDELPKGAKQVLAGCFSVIQGFASLRNELSDATGR
jgi:Abortive infection C-terminus